MPVFLLFLLEFENGDTLVIRTCILEDMNSQCGTFKFENDTLEGCILTCDYDGCNGAITTRLNLHLSVLSIFTILILTFIRF